MDVKLNKVLEHLLAAQGSLEDLLKTEPVTTGDKNLIKSKLWDLMGTIEDPTWDIRAMQNQLRNNTSTESI